MQPDPAVFAALARSADAPNAAAQQQQFPWPAAPQQHNGITGPASGKLLGPVYNGSSGGNFSNLGRINNGPASGRGIAAASGPHSGSGIACRSMLRDLAQSADQSKQDEVFIGGLPSHWKAQQVKELLAPYGQLKSLSVAMDAATGKNKVCDLTSFGYCLLFVTEDLQDIYRATGVCSRTRKASRN
jgi:hypothetical protein